MTKGPFSCHCERFKESRGNLKLRGGTFSTGSLFSLYELFHFFSTEFVKLPLFSRLKE